MLYYIMLYVLYYIICFIHISKMFLYFCATFYSYFYPIKQDQQSPHKVKLISFHDYYNCYTV